MPKGLAWDEVLSEITVDTPIFVPPNAKSWQQDAVSVAAESASPAKQPAAPATSTAAATRKQRPSHQAKPNTSSGTSTATVLCLVLAASMVLPAFFLDSNPFQNMLPTSMIPLHPREPYDHNSAAPLHAQVWYLQPQTISASIHASLEGPAQSETLTEGDGSPIADSAAECHAEGLASPSEIADALTRIWTSDTPPPECSVDSDRDASQPPHDGIAGQDRDSCSEDGAFSWQARAQCTSKVLGQVVSIREAVCWAGNALRGVHELLQVLSLCWLGCVPQAHQPVPCRAHESLM